MSTAITLIPPAQQETPVYHWLDYFDPRAAVDSVSDHIAKQASDRLPERSTRKVYEWGLKDLLKWLGDEMPTKALMTQYIADLVQRGLKRSTINARHVAVSKLYLNALADQQRPGLTGDLRDFVADCVLHIRQAADIEPPAKETTSHIAALWDPRFKRLSLKQVKKALKAINRKSLIGLRDYALLRVGFSTGLRLAELQRITLTNITKVDRKTYLITVRGKRNNSDPVSLDRKAYKAVMAYVKAFNRTLTADDPRRIQHDVPIWQPIHRYNRPYPADHHDPCNGLSRQAIRDMIGNRTEKALGAKWRLSPHDLRRTFASLAYAARMPLEYIQKALRHSDIKTTMHYIGVQPDYEKQTLGHRVKFR